jgi:tetratricopeptide (TPR) repeat protein
MKTNRVFILIGLLLLVACAGGAAWLDRVWFMSWRGNRAADFSPLRYAIGDGQKIFAGHFYRKADVYFHSGMYPSIFDNNESFKTAHISEDAGATGSKNTGDEHDFLGSDRDIIDRFSRNFFPSQHTHLDQGGAGGHSHDAHGHHHQGESDHHHGTDDRVIELGDGTSGEVREILPWLKIAQELDPENPLTYSVSAYWLRSRMNKLREAELLLREGLKHLPNHPVLLFELGRIYFENKKDIARARNTWSHAARSWHKQESVKAEPDHFIQQQIQAHLAKLEEVEGNTQVAIAHWEQVMTHSPNPEQVKTRIVELTKKIKTDSPIIENDSR